MKHKKLSTRILALTLSVAMVFGVSPITASATEGDSSIDTNNVKCHVKHDTTCSYIEAVEGTPAIEEVPCDKDCEGEHVEDCAYRAAVPEVFAIEGVPCNHTCEICTPTKNENTDNQPVQEQCACDVLCTMDNINAECKLCIADGADLTDCKGKESIAPTENSEYDKVVELFTTLPNISLISEKITEEEKESILAKLSAAMDAFNALNTDEQDKFRNEQQKLYNAAMALNDAVWATEVAIQTAATLGDGTTEATPIEVSTWKELDKAIPQMSSKPSYSSPVYIKLTNDIICPAGGYGLESEAFTEVFIDLNGYTIDRGLSEAMRDGYVLKVSGKLTVKDSSSAGTGTITGGYNKTYGGGILVSDYDSYGKASEFTLESGTIAGNKSTLYGAGIYVGNCAKFYLKGGKITDNQIINENPNDDPKGAGIYAAKGFGGSGETLISVSGSPVVEDNTMKRSLERIEQNNICLSDITIDVGSTTQLTAGARLGISSSHGGTCAVSKTKVDDNAAQYFFADDALEVNGKQPYSVIKDQGFWSEPETASYLWLVRYGIFAANETDSDSDSGFSAFGEEKETSFMLYPSYLDPIIAPGFKVTDYTFKWYDSEDNLVDPENEPCKLSPETILTGGEYGDVGIARLKMTSSKTAKAGEYYLVVTAIGTDGKTHTNPCINYEITKSKAPDDPYEKEMTIDVPLTAERNLKFKLPSLPEGIKPEELSASIKDDSANMLSNPTVFFDDTSKAWYLSFDTIGADEEAAATIEIEVGESTSYSPYKITCKVTTHSGPSISVGAQAGAATYNTAASSTFDVTANNFGGDKYPAFAPKVVWTSGTAPKGVNLELSKDNAKLTMTTTAETPADSHSFKVVSAKADTGNYESDEATLKVNELEATITWGTKDSFEYNGKAQAPSATVSNKVGSDVVTIIVTGAQTNVGTGYTATASALEGAAAGNYKMPASLPTKTFSIIKANYNGTQAVAPTAPEASKTGNSITLDAQKITDEVVEYAISTSNIAPTDDSLWQESNTFSGLIPETGYYFFARVKENDDHGFGKISTSAMIKTDKSDEDKVSAASAAIKKAIDSFTPTNITDADAIIALAEKALKDASITGITLGWDTDGAFNQIKSTENAAGSITGKIKLTCGNANDVVDLNKTISKLPSDPAEKIKLVKATIEAALKEYTATNSTTADNIKELAESVKTASNVNGVTIAWKVPDDFVIQTPTDSVNGKVTGTLNLSCDSESDTVLVNCPIERSDEQKLADANAKALAALLAMIATNNTTADDVIAVINNALSNTGVTAAWKTDNGFAKTLATKDASGLITGMIELTLNHKTSDVTVNLTIVCLAGDKKALADTITEANNAKSGIIINNNPASSVAKGTKFVTMAEMNAFTDAIAAAQAVVNKPNSTEAELLAAVTTLNNAIKTFKDAIKIGTRSSDGGGESSSDGGGTTTVTPPSTTPVTPPSTNPVVVAPNTTQPNPPATVETKVPAIVDKNGNATVNVTDKIMQDAIDKAVTEAKKNGTEDNGISIIISVTTKDNNANTVTVNLPKTVQEKVISSHVVNTIVVIDRPDIAINMNLESITEINKQAKADVQLSATRIDNSTLSAEAKTAIGTRHAFNLEATYADGTNAVTSFGTGSVTIEIPYILQDNEVASGLYAVYVNENGNVSSITDSSYDTKAEVLRFTTNHFSIYGIGYKAPIGFTDIADHWAKTDIEFVENRGLLAGTSDTTFEPNAAMTRGMFVTALGRLAKVDTNSYKTESFTDVKIDAYYAPYVNWAVSNGITNGTTSTTFSPDQIVTRQEMAVFMSNYTNVLGYKIPETCAPITFDDNNNIGSWAATAVKQMQMAGVLSGKDSNRFDPTGKATRAEVSATLHRYVELVIDSANAQDIDMNDNDKIV